MPEPIVIYNEMQITTQSFDWIEDSVNPPLEDAGSQKFKDYKRKAELSMDKFYVSRNETWDLGYQRSIVVQFSKGMVRPGGNPQNPQYFTNAKVEQHFYNYSTSDLGQFILDYKRIHKEILKNENSTTLIPNEMDRGKFAINPQVDIQQTHTCFNDSLKTFFLRNSEFRVEGADTDKSVGEAVQIKCLHGHQFFTKDE